MLTLCPLFLRNLWRADCSPLNVQLNDIAILQLQFNAHSESAPGIVRRVRQCLACVPQWQRQSPRTAIIHVSQAQFATSRPPPRRRAKMSSPWCCSSLVSMWCPCLRAAQTLNLQRIASHWAKKLLKAVSQRMSAQQGRANAMLLTRAMGPPSWASGTTCPMTNPWDAPENRPSVMKPTESPRPAPMMAAVGVSISGIPGPPFGPSYRMTMTAPCSQDAWCDACICTYICLATRK